VVADWVGTDRWYPGLPWGPDVGEMHPTTGSGTARGTATAGVVAAVTTGTVLVSRTGGAVANNGQSTDSATAALTIPPTAGTPTDSGVGGTATVGDVAVVLTLRAATGGTVTPPSADWMRLSGPDLYGTNLQGYLWAKDIGPGDPGSTVVFTAAASRFIATLDILRGTTVAALVAAVAGQAGSGTTLPGAAVSVPTAAAAVLSGWAARLNSGTTAPDLTAPAGYTPGAYTRTAYPAAAHYSLLTGSAILYGIPGTYGGDPGAASGSSNSLVYTVGAPITLARGVARSTGSTGTVCTAIPTAGTATAHGSGSALTEATLPELHPTTGTATAVATYSAAVEATAATAGVGVAAVAGAGQAPTETLVEITPTALASATGQAVVVLLVVLADTAHATGTATAGVAAENVTAPAPTPAVLTASVEVAAEILTAAAVQAAHTLAAALTEVTADTAATATAVGTGLGVIAGISDRDVQIIALGLPTGRMLIITAPVEAVTVLGRPEEPAMRLEATGQEFTHLPVSASVPLVDALLVGVLRVGLSPDEDTDWRQSEWDDNDPVPALDRVLRLIVAGYRMRAPHPDAFLLGRGHHRVWVTWPDHPERIVRPAPGRIVVYG
jgi:hypothetical protein